VKIVNTTPHPTAEVGRVLRFGFGRHQPELVRVRIRGSRSGALGATSPTGRVVHIGLSGAYPTEHHYPGVRRAPRMTVANWREELVAIAAHEATHVAGGDDELGGEFAAKLALQRWRRR
jgi:hypothetical protein